VRPKPAPLGPAAVLRCDLPNEAATAPERGETPPARGRACWGWPNPGSVLCGTSKMCQVAQHSAGPCDHSNCSILRALENHESWHNICYKDGVAQRGSYHTLSLCTSFGEKSSRDTQQLNDITNPNQFSAMQRWHRYPKEIQNDMAPTHSNSGTAIFEARVRDMMCVFVSKRQSRGLWTNGLEIAWNDAVVLEKVGGIATGQMHIATQDPPGTGLYQFRCCRQLQPNCPYWFDLIPQVNPSLIANFCYKYVSTNLRFSQHWKSPESDLRLRSAPRRRIQVLHDLQIALLLVGVCQQQHLCFQQMYTNVAFGRNSTARRLSDLPISNPQYEPTSNLSHGSLNVPIEHHPTIRYMVYNGYYKVMSNIPKMGQFPTPVS